MSDATHSDDPCLKAFAVMQAFLHNELDEVDADLVRAHLDACEACLSSFDIEGAITALVRRCQPPQRAPQGLRMQIMGLTIHKSPGA